MNDIPDILRALLDQYSMESVVDSEFKKMLDEDPQLMADYEEWCTSMGYDVSTGYNDFVDELVESRDSIWDNINE